MRLDKKAFQYNKGKILAALKHAQVGSLTLWYCGEKNSGHFEDMVFRDLEGRELEAPPPKASLTNVLAYVTPLTSETRPKIKPLGMAVSDLIYDYFLDQLNPGWAAKAGSEGYVEFDTQAGVIRQSHKPAKRPVKISTY